MPDIDSPQFDSKQYGAEVNRQLQGLDYEKSIAFAARCALRAAPWLMAGWRSQDEQAKWMRNHLANMQAALAQAFVWGRIAPTNGLDDVSSARAALDVVAVAVRDAAASYAVGNAADTTVAAAEAADAAINAVYHAAHIPYIDGGASNSVENAITNAAANASFIALRFDSETRRLMQKAVEMDLNQLKRGASKDRLLGLPLWTHVPTAVHMLLDQWLKLGTLLMEAATFAKMLHNIHLRAPDWPLLVSGVHKWRKDYPRNRRQKTINTREQEGDSSSPPEDEYISPGSPQQPLQQFKVRRIIQPRLVSTTCVAADGEAEHLTLTAQRCMLALREFLVSDDTHTPLTVAVEAPWGGGKSSLMRHLQESLMNAEDKYSKKCSFKEEAVPTVWFNPWKHDAGKTLWAAFAVAFERQMAENCGFSKRQWKRVCLSVARLEAVEKIQLFLRFSFWIGALILLGCIAYQHSNEGTVAGWKDQMLQHAPWLGMIVTLWAFLKDAVKQLGSPLKLDVSRLLTHNDHADKVDDLHRFHEDFRRMIRAYIPTRKNGKAGKAVVFVDDLDRCEAPKAAELLQSLHQMLNVHERSRSAAEKDAPGIICVLGMDREKVAAAVAAKHEKLLPLLMKTDVNGKVSRENAMIFGHEFLEKFIQLTLHLPPLQGRDLEEYLSSIIGTKESRPHIRPPADIAFTMARNGATNIGFYPSSSVVTSAPVAGSETSERQEHQAAVERIEGVTEDLEDGFVILQCARYAAPALENNPRKLKQFVNLFRLRLYLAAAMNFLDLPDREADKPNVEPLRSPPKDKLSVHHLAKLVALELAAPSEMTAIRETSSQNLFAELEKAFPADTKPSLHALLAYRDAFEPEAYDLSKASLHAYFHYFKAETPTT